MFGFILEYYTTVYFSVNETSLKGNTFYWSVQVSFKSSLLYILGLEMVQAYNWTRMAAITKTLPVCFTVQKISEPEVFRCTYWAKPCCCTLTERQGWFSVLATLVSINCHDSYIPIWTKCGNSRVSYIEWKLKKKLLVLKTAWSTPQIWWHKLHWN